MSNIPFDSKKILIWCLTLFLLPAFFIAMVVPVEVLYVEEPTREEESFLICYSTHFEDEHTGNTLDKETIEEFDRDPS